MAVLYQWHYWLTYLKLHEYWFQKEWVYPCTHLHSIITLSSHIYSDIVFVNDWWGNLPEMACYTFRWIVSLSEGRDRNLVATQYDGNGRFPPTVLVQSAQEPCHVDSRGFHPFRQGIMVNVTIHWKIWVLSNNNNHSPFHLWSGNLAEWC